MSAILSDDGRYRYRLEREVSDVGCVAAIFGVNPSTADATTNDATIRKDMGFARINGWRRIIKGNLFAYRATDVRELARVPDPNGPDNDHHIWSIMTDADVVVVAWGPTSKLPRQLRERWRVVAHMAIRCRKPLWCLGVANDGQPRHTLMLPYASPLVPWMAPL